MRGTLGRPGSFRQLWLHWWGLTSWGCPCSITGKSCRGLFSSGYKSQWGQTYSKAEVECLGQAGQPGLLLSVPQLTSNACWTYKAGVTERLLQPEYPGIYSTTAHRVQHPAPDNLIQAEQYHANAIESIM